MTGGVADVLVVGRPDDGALREEVAGLGAGVRFVENHHAEDGQISSIVAAANVIDRPGVRGLLVVPVDQPLVLPATVAALLAAFTRLGPPVARATCRGRHGHPVIFAAAVFGDLRAADRTIGARAVLRAHGSAVLDVDVADEGVLIDVDDPDDYARVFGFPL